MRRILPALLLGSLATAQTTLIWPGTKLATIDAEHLRAYVPFEHRESLKRLVARADQIYAKMCEDAGFEPSTKLRLLFGNWVDQHNGFSFVTPFPLVQVELAPALQDSTIFNGFNFVERTLIHEFAHQISNDRNHGFRGVLETIFGRLLPNDLLSFLLFYLSTPSHQTMPRFWHEGLATWAETAYSDPNNVWAGRGRDALTHMVWRLDTAADQVPPVADWRITWHEWPFGSRTYTYGVAYTRFLSTQFGDDKTVWDFIDVQARRWPFLFNGGPRRIVRRDHISLIEWARRELEKEQQEQLAILRGAPITELERLTPKDMIVRAPAWIDDDTVAFAGKQQQGRLRLHYLHADGTLEYTWTLTRALAEMRATTDGELVYHELNWRQISRAQVAGETFGWRMLQPDADYVDDELTLVALQLRGGGVQELVSYDRVDGDFVDERVIPTQGMPWSPVLRRGNRVPTEVVWVETDDTGSRLVMAPLANPAERRVLFEQRGRILHPVWTEDGAHLFFCSDHTGVPNAYRLTPGAEIEVIPVTNTIGGVIACVPSPDGTQLALVDHDENGPFIAKLSADPETWVETVPTIRLAWPAPLSTAEPGERPSPAGAIYGLPDLPAGAEDELTAEAYNGFKELQPLFWAPTSFAVPAGGWGVYGLAADPIFSHVIQAGVGVGLNEQEPVGRLSWDYLGWPIEIGVRGGQSELTFANVIEDTASNTFDFTETVRGGEFRFGRGLFGLERTLLLNAGIGVADRDAVDESLEDFAGRSLVNRPFFEGEERYVEVTLGYDDTFFYPTSYSFEDGLGVTALFRHSGLGGDLDRDLAFGGAGYVWSLFPEWGHQLVVAGQVGWSEGDPTLQGSFSIGGGLSRGFPRGYIDKAVATGDHLVAGSVAYRFPVYRPFAAASTTPFRGRQLVLELFADSGKVSDDHPGGDGEWFSSVGGQLHINFEFFDSILNPGIGVAYQLDGERDVEVFFALGFGF